MVRPSFFQSAGWRQSTFICIQTQQRHMVTELLWALSGSTEPGLRHGRTNPFSCLNCTLLCLLWRYDRLKNSCIIFLTDNESNTSFINKQTSPNKQLMVLIRRLVKVCLKHNIIFQAEHIRGVLNVQADCLSHLRLNLFRESAPWANVCPTVIPPLPALPPWLQHCRTLCTRLLHQHPSWRIDAAGSCSQTLLIWFSCRVASQYPSLHWRYILPIWWSRATGQPPFPCTFQPWVTCTSSRACRTVQVPSWYCSCSNLFIKLTQQ